MVRARNGTAINGTWRTAGGTAHAHLVRELESHASEEDYRRLRVLLGNASIGLAPDGAVPVEPEFSRGMEYSPRPVRPSVSFGGQVARTFAMVAPASFVDAPP